MQPAVKRTDYLAFVKNVQAFADQINQGKGIAPPEQPSLIQRIYSTVIDVNSDGLWRNPSARQSCQALNAALGKLSPSPEREKIITHLNSFNYPLPTELIREILKLAVHNGFAILPLMKTCKKFKEIVTTEVVNYFKEFRAGGLFHEERFAFLDEVDATPSQQYLAFKKIATPCLALIKVIGYDYIALPLLRLPYLDKLDWDVAYKQDGGLPLRLDNFENVKEGMTIHISHALIDTIPNELKEKALLTFKDCSFRDLERNKVIGTRVPLNKQQYIVNFFECQFTFNLRNLGLLESVYITPELGREICAQQGVVKIHHGVMGDINFSTLSEMYITSVTVYNVGNCLKIFPTLLHLPSINLLEWRIAEHRHFIDLEDLHLVKPGILIKIFNAHVAKIPERLLETADLKFTTCRVNEPDRFDNSEPTFSYSTSHPAPKFSVEFSKCVIKEPPPAYIACPPTGELEITSDKLMYAQNLSTVPIKRLIVKVKKTNKIPPFVLKIPTLINLKWEALSSLEEGQTLELDELTDIKPGFNLEVTNAFLPSIPQALRERAILRFSACYFKGALNKVQGHLVGSQWKFDVIFKRCIIDLTFAELGMVEAEPGVIQRAKSESESCLIS